MGKPLIEFTAEQTAEVERLAKRLNCNRIAQYFGVSKNTFLRIRERQPEVMTAYQKGKAEAAEYVVSKLFENIDNNDTTAILFYLKTQEKWSEKSNREINKEAIESLDFSSPEAKAESSNKLIKSILEHDHATLDDVKDILKNVISPTAIQSLEVPRVEGLKYATTEELLKVQALLDGINQRVEADIKSGKIAR
jgi:hypothetical protein